MKIKIKRKLNEGKGADIIAHGLTVNLLSGMAKKIFDKFGGIESAIKDDNIVQATELAIAMESSDKDAMLKNSRALAAVAKKYEQNREAIKNKRISDAKVEADKLLADYINYELSQNQGLSYDELMYGPMGGGAFYGAVVQQGEGLIQKAENEPTEILDKQINDLHEASKRFLDASKM